ncbi:MAG: T9SS type A sorting domain-containing protein [Bacteroidales bacterium]|nr:T9SS type A sorting domain-containing protein [Bacteroidales bacterium]
MPDVKMEWFQLSGVSFYEYEVDTNLLFDSPALQEGKLLDTSSYVYGDHLLFDAKYYWRVRAGHTTADVSSWCLPWSYITLRTFLLTGPLPQATMQVPNVQLKWKEVTGINFYEYELSEDSLFASPMSFVTDTVINYAEELSFGTKYYFRAKAVNDNDESDWTDVRYFTVVEKVALSSPANNSTNVSIRPVMKWDLITGINSYQLQYADNPAFNNAFDDIYPATQTEYQVEGNGLDSATVYYWRVRAIHSQDTSDWSDVWNYKIAVTGIEDVIFDKSDIHIYPNPTSEEFFIKLNSEYPMDIQLSVMDLLGQLLINEEIHFNKGKNTREIKLKNLNNGIYLVKLQKGSEQFVTKIVIDKR